MVALITLPAQAADFQDITYANLVKDPSAAKRNTGLRTYLMGIALVIKLEYLCRHSDREILEDPDKMIDTMTEFSKTTWGSLYLENTSGPGGIPWPMHSGVALLQIFTEHGRCTQYEAARPQKE
jgi:hypothetical protein